MMSKPLTPEELEYIKRKETPPDGLWTSANKDSSIHKSQDNINTSKKDQKSLIDLFGGGNK